MTYLISEKVREIYLTHKGGKPLLAFANSNEQLNLVDFNGKNQPLKYENLAPGWHLNVANINKDNEDELIFTAGKRLKIYNLSGQEIYSKEIEANSLDFPYVYRFSGNDIRIGLLDRDRAANVAVEFKNRNVGRISDSGRFAFLYCIFRQW